MGALRRPAVSVWSLPGLPGLRFWILWKIRNYQQQITFADTASFNVIMMAIVHKTQFFSFGFPELLCEPWEPGRKEALWVVGPTGLQLPLGTSVVDFSPMCLSLCVCVIACLCPFMCVCYVCLCVCASVCAWVWVCVYVCVNSQGSKR